MALESLELMAPPTQIQNRPWRSTGVEDPMSSLFPLKRQVGFGSSWRNRAKNNYLMARTSLNIGDGGNGGAYGGEDEKEEERDLLPGAHGLNLNSTSDISSGNGEIGEPEPEENKNLEDGKNKLFEDHLKQIKDELRKNNEEMKRLRETVLHPWNILRGVFATPSILKTVLQLIDKNKNHPLDSEPIQQQLPAQDLKTTVDANGSKQSSNSPQSPKLVTPLLQDKVRQLKEYDHQVYSNTKQPTELQLIDKNKNHRPDSEPVQQRLPAQESKTSVVANGLKQSSKSPQTPKPVARRDKRRLEEYDRTMHCMQRPRRQRGNDN